MTSQITLDITSPIASEEIAICCWYCRAPLSPITSPDTATCGRCHRTTAFHEGIWRSLSPEDAARFKHFIADYEHIRAAESRGSLDPAYYRALPFQDLTGKLTEQWKIRAATFRHIERHILTPLAARHARPLRILDLGAGNGWLSNRLSLLGHQPVAVDLLTNARDGLGAAIHYRRLFPRVNASLDRLPFADATFDLAIFNASFHYATDYTTTLAEALRCIAPSGQVVIADTPWYRHEASGMQMVREKHAHFEKTYGIPSNALASQEFLTPVRLDHLVRTLNIQWQTLKPFYGLQWALRPVRAWLSRRRSSSRFRIFVAEARA